MNIVGPDHVYKVAGKCRHEILINVFLALINFKPCRYLNYKKYSYNFIDRIYCSVSDIKKRENRRQLHNLSSTIFFI